MMIRRDLIKAGMALGMTTLHGGAIAASLKKMRIGNAAQINDPQQCFITVGGHPRLKYYEMEGIEVEFVNMSNQSQSMQGVATRKVEFGTVSAGLYLPAMAKDPTLDIVAAYKWLGKSVSVLVVKPDSPIRTAKDLVGKKIGVQTLGDSSVFSAKAVFRELGLDPRSIEFVAIGSGGVAGNAIDQGRVDAMATIDTSAARIELTGTKLRYLELPQEFIATGGSWFGVSKLALKEDRKAFVGLFRGLSKSTLFAKNNVAEAIKIHWELYPESKPKGKSLDEGLKEFEFILKDRKDRWGRSETSPDPRIGASALTDWKANLVIATDTTGNPNLGAEIGDLNKIFTNELIDEVNDFNKAAVIKEAREFRL